jgi:hypothetical protein
MARLKALEVACLAHSVGITLDVLPTAVAVCYGESGKVGWFGFGPDGGCETTAFNPKGADLSYGLWQINMKDEPLKMGTERRAKYGLATNEQLFDPLINAKVMFDMSKGGIDWNPWGAWRGGHYKKHMWRAKAATNDLRKFLNKGYYLVKAGDTLWSISTRHEMPLKQLLRLNPALREDSVIHVADLIRVR